MDELPRPNWMDAENDDSHKAEVEPLFGTGNLSLHDEVDNHDFDVEQQPGKKTDYGAIATEASDSDDEDEEDHDVEHTVISSATSASGSSKQSSKSGLWGTTKKKAKMKTREIVITESGKPEIPRPSCLMASFHSIESLGVITCLALMASQVMPLIAIPWSELGVANICLKVYIGLFCVLFVLIEWDVPIGFLKHASFLQAYVCIHKCDGNASFAVLASSSFCPCFFSFRVDSCILLLDFLL
jgi:hypothetical protein